MAVNKNKLGRGLSSLLGERGSVMSSLIDNKNIVRELDIAAIEPNRFQPRTDFNEDELNDLARSIREFGILQPIVVRKVVRQEVESYEIVSGERRFRAAKIVGMTTVSAIVRNMSDNESLSLAIIENIQRSDLSPLEESRAYRRLMDEFNYTQQQIADAVGKSRSHISNLIRLLTLPDEILKMLDDRKIEVGHAKILINLENALEIANRIVADGLTVRETERLVQERQKKTPVTRGKSLNLNARNSPELGMLEKKIDSMLGVRAKAVFNAKSNSGTVTIKLKDMAEVERLLKILK